MVGKLGSMRRSLDRKLVRLRVGARSKCVGAVVKHILREVTMVGGRLNVEVAEHGIRVPATKEGNVFGGNIGT